MPSLRKQLSQAFQTAFIQAGLDPKYGDVSVSDRPDLAQFQCNGALAAAKAQKKNPREVAQKILDTVELCKDRFQFSLAGPGFINIVLTDDELAQRTQEQAQDKRRMGCDVQPAKKIVIDFGGPNVAKTMHVGHLRSSIIGDSLQRICRWMLDDENNSKQLVIGDNHLGDWGSPMGMLICELKRRHPNLPYFDPAKTGPYPTESPVTMTDLEEMYPLAAAKFKADENEKADVLRATDELQKGRPGYLALWKHFVSVTRTDLERDFGSLGIQFDHWLGESFYEALMPKMIESLKKQGMTEMSEGALIIPLATTEEPELPPLILEKSGGGYLYHTSDMATVEYRVNHFKAELILYVIDKRQSLHLKQVFMASRKTGLAKNAEMIHTAFGTMNGTDGKPFRTRAGGVLKLKDLIQMVTDEAKKRLTEMDKIGEYSEREVDEISKQVGIATLKYADLKNNRTSDYVFDLAQFSQFEGNTGPYLQYAVVRIQSLINKANFIGSGSIQPPQTASERTLMLTLLRLPDVIQRAYELYEPHHLCDYGFTLSQAFNSFYNECHIISEQDPDRKASLLRLCAQTRNQLILVLRLLGIEVPEKM